MSKKWTRRSALGLIGSGAGLLTWGTGGFTDVTAKRQVNVDTTKDPDGPLLGINTLDPTGGPGRTVSLIKLTNNLGEKISQIKLNDATVNSNSTEVADLFKGEGVSDTNYFDLPSDLGTTKQGTIEATLGIPGAPAGYDREYDVTFDITATAGSQEVTLSRKVNVNYDDPRISWWSFEEVNDGTVPDKWGSNDATRANYDSVGYEPDKYSSTSRGDLLYYDGTSGDVVEVSDEDALDFTGDFSLSVWIYPGDQSGLARLFSKWDSSIENGYQFFLTSNNEVGIETANETVLSTGITAQSSEWSHVVWTHGSSEDSVYLNGSEEYYNGDGLGDPVGSDEPLRIGNGIDTFGNLNYPFYGYMDEPKAYDTALTAEQVENLYETSADGDGGSIGG